MKLIKGSPEAKKFMAKIRAKKNINKKATVKKLSGIKESNKLKKDLKAKKLRLTHGYTTVKRKLSGIHKDTKSHNVNVSVISGVKIDNLKRIEALLKSIENFKSYKNTFKMRLKLTTDKADKTILRTAIKQMDRNIIHTNKTITQLKKLI